MLIINHTILSFIIKPIYSNLGINKIQESVLMNFTNISWTHFIAAGATLAVLTFAINLIGIPKVEAKASPQIFDLEAHRGGRDARPENTLVSFAYALELGVTTLEMDIKHTIGNSHKYLYRAIMAISCYVITHVYFSLIIIL